MAKYGVLFALLFVGGFALPASRDDGPGFDEDMSIFFDNTVTDSEGRLVGAEVAEEGAFPWMAALRNGVTQFFFCGGSVITNRHILSAAHCIDSVRTGTTLSPTLRVTVGTNRWADGGQTYTLQGFRNHALYNMGTIKNDIGILITSTQILLSNLVTRVPLNSAFVPGNIASTVTGWGRLEDWKIGRLEVPGRVMAPDLMVLRTTTVDGQRCIEDVIAKGQILNMRPPPVDPAIEICTFVAVNQGACQGDSGSALVLNDNSQIGIVSWGLPCALGAPDIYVRVSAYIDWIVDVVNST